MCRYLISITLVLCGLKIVPRLQKLCAAGPSREQICFCMWVCAVPESLYAACHVHAHSVERQAGRYLCTAAWLPRRASVAVPQMKTSSAGCCGQCLCRLLTLLSAVFGMLVLAHGLFPPMMQLWKLYSTAACPVVSCEHQWWPLLPATGLGTGLGLVWSLAKFVLFPKAG